VVEAGDRLRQTFLLRAALAAAGGALGLAVVAQALQLGQQRIGRRRARLHEALLPAGIDVAARARPQPLRRGPLRARLEAVERGAAGLRAAAEHAHVVEAT